MTKVPSDFDNEVSATGGDRTAAANRIREHAGWPKMMPAPLAALQKRAILMDSALDAVVGDLYLREIGAIASDRATLASIRETIVRFDTELRLHRIPSLYDIGIRPEVLDD